MSKEKAIQFLMQELNASECEDERDEITESWLCIGTIMDKYVTEANKPIRPRVRLTHDVWVNELDAVVVSDDDEPKRYQVDTIEFNYEMSSDNYWIQFLDATQTRPFYYKDEIEAVVKAITAY